MLCQQLTILAAHGSTRAIAQDDQGELVLIWDSALICLTSDSLLGLADVLAAAAAQPTSSISTSTFQWHPAPDDAALIWMARICFYLPSPDKLIFHDLITSAADIVRAPGEATQRCRAPSGSA